MQKEIQMLRLILLTIIILLLTACAQPGDQAAKTIENYIKALVEKDANRLSALSCAAWEPDAQLELDSFQSIATKLEGLSCASISTDDNVTSVQCQGNIIATYNNEDEKIDLSFRPYKVINQGGEFLMCGYQ